MQEEIFGPVIVVVPFDDEDEAIAHRQRHRRSASTTTCSRGDTAGRMAVAKQLRSGNVGINTLQRNHERRSAASSTAASAATAAPSGLHAYSELQSIIWPG